MEQTSKSFELEITSIPQTSIAVTMFCINKSLPLEQGGWHPNIFEVMEQASSEVKLEQLELERRDLLRTNGSQHCLSDLSRDNTALAFS